MWLEVRKSVCLNESKCWQKVGQTKFMRILSHLVPTGIQPRCAKLLKRAKQMNINISSGIYVATEETVSHGINQMRTTYANFIPYNVCHSVLRLRVSVSLFGYLLHHTLLYKLFIFFIFIYTVMNIITNIISGTCSW